MNHLLECQNCLNNARNPHLLCALHPYGSVGNCPDFDRQSHLYCHVGHGEPEELWEPSGASYYGGELVLTTLGRWTKAQQLELLMWHPLFTGLCPVCRHEFSREDLPLVHWDCPTCGWQDDSL
jgi:hypothetical protein